ncbi:unnamed protein product [Arctogadus glacialis]
MPTSDEGQGPFTTEGCGGDGLASTVPLQGPHQRPGGHQTALHVWEEHWRLSGKWGLSFCWHGSVSLCDAPQQGTPGTGTASLTTDLSLKRIISILPKMDGNLLHELLAASERGAGSPRRSHVLHADLLLGLS